MFATALNSVSALRAALEERRRMQQPQTPQTPAAAGADDSSSSTTAQGAADFQCRIMPFADGACRVLSVKSNAALAEDFERCASHRAIVLLDVSGSMQAYLRSIQAMIETFQARCAEANIAQNQVSVVCFSDTINAVFDMSYDMREQSETQISYMNGGTSFQAAFMHVAEMVRKAKHQSPHTAFSIAFMTDGQCGAWEASLASLHGTLDSTCDTINAVFCTPTGSVRECDRKFYENMQTISFPETSLPRVFALNNPDAMNAWFSGAVERCANTAQLRITTHSGRVVSAALDNNGEELSGVMIWPDSVREAATPGTVTGTLRAGSYERKVLLDIDVPAQQKLTELELLQLVRTVAASHEATPEDMRNLALIAQDPAVRAALQQGEIDCIVRAVRQAEVSARHVDVPSDDDDDIPAGRERPLRPPQTKITVSGREAATSLAGVVSALQLRTFLKAGTKRRQARAIHRVAVKARACRSQTDERMEAIGNALVNLVADRKRAPAAAAAAAASRPFDTISMCDIAVGDVALVEFAGVNEDVRAILATNPAAVRCLPLGVRTLDTFMEMSKNNQTTTGAPSVFVVLLPIDPRKHSPASYDVLETMSSVLSRCFTAGMPILSTTYNDIGALFNIIGHAVETLGWDSDDQQRLSMAMSLVPYAWHLAKDRLCDELCSLPCDWRLINRLNHTVDDPRTNNQPAPLTQSATAFLGYFVTHALTKGRDGWAQGEDVRRALRIYCGEIVRLAASVDDVRKHLVPSDAEMAQLYDLLASADVVELGDLRATGNIGADTAHIMRANAERIVQAMEPVARASIGRMLANMTSTLRAGSNVAPSRVVPSWAVMNAIRRVEHIHAAVRDDDGWTTLAHDGSMLAEGMANFVQQCSRDDIVQMWACAMGAPHIGTSTWYLRTMDVVDLDGILGAHVFTTTRKRLARAILRTTDGSNLELFWQAYKFAEQTETPVHPAATVASLVQYAAYTQLTQCEPVQAWLQSKLVGMSEAEILAALGNRYLHVEGVQLWLVSAGLVSESALDSYRNMAPQLHSEGFNKRFAAAADLPADLRAAAAAAAAGAEATTTYAVDHVKLRAPHRVSHNGSTFVIHAVSMRLVHREWYVTELFGADGECLFRRTPAGMLRNSRQARRLVRHCTADARAVKTTHSTTINTPKWLRIAKHVDLVHVTFTRDDTTHGWRCASITDARTGRDIAAAFPYFERV